MSIPDVESYLPELMAFIRRLAGEFERGALTGWPQMTEHVQAFFTPLVMQQMEAVISGWRAMSAYADGQTLLHVTSVLTALLLCREYRQATPEQQRLMEWIVLFHDLAKVARHDKRDFIHGFRSAALTGKQLSALNFAVSESYAAGIADWCALTWEAINPHLQTGELIQDNRRLPDIMTGIERLFGQDTPAALVVKTVLLHMSVDTVTMWPQAAALTEEEMRTYVRGDLLPLLEIMTLVDGDAWSLFDPETRRVNRDETLAAFARQRQQLKSS